MGQRHQIYLIARTKSRSSTQPLYRSLGGIHHQWCYGSLPISGLNRFYSLLGNTVNAALVKYELANLEDMSNEDLAAYPCPYTQRLLAEAFYIDIDNKEAIYLHKSGSDQDNQIAANQGCWSIENDDGITIIDITDLSRLSYAMSFDNDILTAPEYLRSYYKYDSPDPELPADASDEEKKQLEVDKRHKQWWNEILKPYKDRHLIPRATLHAVWPKEFKYKAQSTIVATVEPIAVGSKAIPSLVELTLRPAVQQSLSSGETKELETMALQPDKATVIELILREYGPIPDAGLPILGAVLGAKSPSVLDLSNFSITDRQFIIFLAHLTSQKNVIEELNLSNTSLGIATMEIALSTFPTIERIILMDSVISISDINDLINAKPSLFYRLNEIIHPDLLTSSLAHHPGGFSAFVYELQPDIMAMFGMGSTTTNSAYLPIWTPARVVQALSDYFLGTMHLPHEEFLGCIRMGSSNMGGMMFSAAFGGAFRKGGTKWSNRVIPHPVKPTKGQAKGWSFIWRSPDSLIISFSLRSAFGFVFVGEDKEGSADLRVFGLREWLTEMEKEGRPMPEEAAVKELETAMDQLMQAGIKKIDVDSVATAIKEIEERF